MASYGGGHVAALLPLARRLQADDRVELICLGFTTARAVFEAAGFAVIGARDMLEPGDESWLALAEPLLEQVQHAAIEPEDALAYYAVGLKDLARSMGLDAALTRIKTQGRHCFEPVDSCRALLQRLAPDLLITSTCPRSELALQKAARQLEINALAVGDLFLQHEAAYVCAPDYAPHLSVIAESVRQRLRQQDCSSEIHVCGNPAFDALLDPGHRAQAQAFRQSLDLDSTHHLLLWACHPAVKAFTGRNFVEPMAMLSALEDYAGSHPEVRVLIRQHPSAPLFAADQLVRHGWICPPDLPLETCLHAVDQVVVELSTVGLQAALLGKPLVTIQAGQPNDYGQLGLAVDAPDLEAMPAALDLRQSPDLKALGYPLQVPAASCLEQLCQSILERER